MSKRSKTKAAPKPTPAAPLHPDQEPSGAEILRRMLLAVLTLVIVARPFVRGEDAGLLSDLSDPGGMVLTLLTLVACAGWAAWRLWAPGGVQVGAVEIGLLLIAVLFAVGAGFAPYARPALFTSAEWFGLVLLLFLTRQLATRPEEQHGLMTALLATAVALSVQGVYQTAYEMPQVLKDAEAARKGSAFTSVVKESEKTRRAVVGLSTVRGVTLTPTEENQLTDQLDRRLVSGPFVRPASMASCLVLLLPLLGGAVVACVRGKSLTLLTGSVAACGLLAGVVLALTRDAPAVAALALAALPWLGLYWPARLGGWSVGVLVGVAAAAGVVFLLYTTGRLDADLARWREVWPAAYRVGDARFWTGVGPGQFRFYYPRFMNADGSHPVAEPSSSLLELFGEAGVGAVVLLLVALVLLGRMVVRWWRVQPSLTPQPPPPQEDRGDVVRWEYYLGGMLAAILSFVLRANSVSPGEVMTEAFGAGLRSVVWFLAFALFERVSWSPGEYVGSLLVGVAAMLLSLLVAPGLGAAGIASLLWVAVGLMLAVVRPEPAVWLRSRYVLGIGLPVLLGLSFGYFAMVLYPASIGTHNLRAAKVNGAILRADQLKKGTHEIKDVEAYIDREIIPRLKTAEKEDVGNVQTREVLARTFIQRWSRIPVTRIEERDAAAKAAVNLTALARRANPEGEEGYLTEYYVYVTMAAEMNQIVKHDEDKLKAADSKDKKKDKKDKLSPQEKVYYKARAAKMRGLAPGAYANAAAAIEEYVPRDPTNPQLRYMLAEARLNAQDYPGAQKAAEEAQELDKKIGPDRPRSLSDRQREQLRRWLGEKSSH